MMKVGMYLSAKVALEGWKHNFAPFDGNFPVRFFIEVFVRIFCRIFIFRHRLALRIFIH